MWRILTGGWKGGEYLGMKNCVSRLQGQQWEKSIGSHISWIKDSVQQWWEMMLNQSMETFNYQDEKYVFYTIEFWQHINIASDRLIQ